LDVNPAKRLDAISFYTLRKEVKKRMSDITLKCKDCGKEFTFTEGEQKFYEEKGFSNPTRCQECRRARKQQHNNNA
jgi:DNA replicative helicase MCM subunit Mcm2 (Cdc46/Mcm family)